MAGSFGGAKLYVAGVDLGLGHTDCRHDPAARFGRRTPPAAPVGAYCAAPPTSQQPAIGRISRGLRDEAGYSLVELLVTITLLSIAIIPIIVTQG